jgi:septum formation protein
MLITDMSIVRAAHVILASASPRRLSIMNDQLDLGVRAVPSSFMEDLNKAAFTPHEYVVENARQKALEVFNKCESPFAAKHSRSPSLVVGADTVVVLDNKILEKPASVEEARRMLSALSAAGTHSVITGVSLVYGSGEAGSSPAHEHHFWEATTVSFKELGDAEIEAYVTSGEPMDKAGAYGIQGLGGAFVTGIVGDYQNVVGFPVSRFCDELDTARLSAWIGSAAEEEEAPALEAEDDPCDPLAPVISEECLDEDECGLPSD